MSFSLHDLGIAYRKAKVDLYYSSQAPLLAIADYESNLAANLRALRSRLNSNDEDWIKLESFLGDWYLTPKFIKPPEKAVVANGLKFSSPADEWEHLCKLADDDKKPKAEFRLMAQTSLDFHVLSALWMLKVGCRYDKKLISSAYGNRLRRGRDGDINPLSLGSFTPYLKPFRDWRDNGVKAMRASLVSGKKIVALTADVSSFYHELNPHFMLDNDFNQLFDIKLSENEEKLHRLFIKALIAWAQNTPLKKGLPVGLPASAVVANMALIELDQLIEKQVVPLYYGRYVDDILLVMENGADFQSPQVLWQWLFDRSSGKLDWADNKQEAIQFQPEYLSNSLIQFSNSKNKVFLLSGETGLTLVDAIAQQIYQRASEWRALPNLPASASQVSTDLVTATQSDGEVADNLRKTDALTMRRSGFAIKLRDFEAYERDLLPQAWQKHRYAFYQAFINHVLVLPYFFDLSQYLPRVVRLAVACEDFEQLHQIMQTLESICETVEEHCDVSIKAAPEDGMPDRSELVDNWQKQLWLTMHESIMAAFPPRLSKEGKAAWKIHMEDFYPSSLSAVMAWSLSISTFQNKQARLFSFDLAHQPFRFIGLPKEMVAQRGIPAKKNIATVDKPDELLPEQIIDGISKLASWIKLPKITLPNGLLFATRPINMAELFVVAKDPFDEVSQRSLESVVLAIRGFTLNEKMPQRNKQDVLDIHNGEKTQSHHTIAVSCWKTNYDSWVASVTRNHDPDINRYQRLTKLVNSVISQPKDARYFILPELALPAQWFMRFAHKLRGRGISFIAGIEYLHATKSRVRNQVWAALIHDGIGFPSLMIYRQDKQRPALHEEQELKRLAGRELKPEKIWKVPPVIQHGDFRFAMLVCSELTNISYRAALCGKVDALFVPEWNQDTETFNALVESAALDIHAYIIQCNDRQYGDSRIRAPYKDSWLRDLLRVKGGVDDYCVTGEIDVIALRRFQSSYRSKAGPFKPVPDGFSMAYERKTMPEGNNE